MVPDDIDNASELIAPDSVKVAPGAIESLSELIPRDSVGVARDEIGNASELVAPDSLGATPDEIGALGLIALDSAGVATDEIGSHSELVAPDLGGTTPEEREGEDSEPIAPDFAVEVMDVTAKMLELIAPADPLPTILDLVVAGLEELGPNPYEEPAIREPEIAPGVVKVVPDKSNVEEDRADCRFAEVDSDEDTTDDVETEVERVNGNDVDSIVEFQAKRVDLVMGTV